MEKETGWQLTEVRETNGVDRIARAIRVVEMPCIRQNLIFIEQRPELVNTGFLKSKLPSISYARRRHRERSYRHLLHSSRINNKLMSYIVTEINQNGQSTRHHLVPSTETLCQGYSIAMDA